MYSDLSVKAFYVYTITKIAAVLVFSINIRYTGLMRANTRHSKNMEQENFLTEGGYFLNMRWREKGGGGEVNAVCSFCPRNYRSFNNAKKLDFSVS